MKKIAIITCAFVAAIVFSGKTVHATSIPNFTASGVTGSAAVQVTVYGADPNASVLLFYPSTASFASTNIGTTNASGYLMANVDSAARGIQPKAQVYVMVNGSQSQQTMWPDYSSAGGLTLNPNALTVGVGQSSVVSVPTSATLTLSNNTNPSVASATLSANQVTVNGLAAGTSNITVCAANIGCGIVYATVQAQSNTTASLSFDQSVISLAVGQGKVINISGSGYSYVSTISNPSVVSASINGSALSINAIIPGTASVNVCTQAGTSASCSRVEVTVTGTSVTAPSAAEQQNRKLSFSQNEVSLSIGQKQTISISGGLGTGSAYTIRSNSNPSSVSAITNGANVELVGVAFGGANVNVCQLDGICGNVYAFVSDTSAPTPTTASTKAPVLASFSVSSNTSNGSFLGSGNILTITVSANQVVSTPTITIAGTSLSPVGSGSGPYTAKYTLVDNRSGLPVSIAFNNVAGTAGQTKFVIGETGAVSGGSNPESSVTATAVISGLITKILRPGSSGAEVRLLQTKLKQFGVYSGPINGVFGPMTEAAVKKLQAKYKLEQVGVVGPATREVLNK